jgi:hypothetical protein
MFPPRRSEPMGPCIDVGRYLGPGERVIYATRRHLVVLDSAVCVWLVTLALAVGAAVSSGGHRGPHLGRLGAAALLAGALFLGGRAWQWWRACYVVTNERVLLIEGIFSRRVNGLPLRSVLDTVYRRTLAGRLRGYGDLELNLAGQPGLRKLTSLPRPDTIYHLILSLTSVRDAMHPMWPRIERW